MAAVSTSLFPMTNPRTELSPGISLKPLDQSIGKAAPANFLLNANCGKLQLCTSRKPLVVQAGYRDHEGPTSASIFVGGFVLGGLIVGTLGCVYAPQFSSIFQISNVLAGADRKDLMRKLPKFIYDEEKALEKTRKVLAEKIAQLNSAIDDVSTQLRSEEDLNGVEVTSDEVEAAI